MEALDGVAFLDVIVVLDADTALVSLVDFLCVVLESLQGADGAFMDDDAVTYKSDFSVAYDFTFLNVSSCDGSYVRHLERGTYFDLAEDFFLELRI